MLNLFFEVFLVIVVIGLILGFSLSYIFYCVGEERAYKRWRK